MGGYFREGLSDSSVAVWNRLRGFFGTGLRMGKPYMIPFASTDFIFSAICEEMGTLTGVAVVLLYMLLCYRAFKIAFKHKEKI